MLPMRTYGVTKSLTLGVIMASTLTIYASPRDNGVYVGLNTSVIQFSADYFEETSDISANGTLLNETETVYRNGDVGSEEIKLGYKHWNKNRVEIFRRSSEIEVGFINAPRITSKAVGINYEWGLASLASANKKVLPFISLGVASGRAKTKSTQLKIKNADVLELEASFGVHYQLSKHFDTTLGLQHKQTILLDDAPPNSSNVFTAGDIDSTSINVGISYHF